MLQQQRAVKSLENQWAACDGGRMAVDTVAQFVRTTREATSQIAEGVDALFTGLEALDMNFQDEDEEGGPQSGFRGTRSTMPPPAMPEVPAHADIEALRRLVVEAIPYVAQHAELEAAIAWLRRADELGCRRRH